MEKEARRAGGTSRVSRTAGPGPLPPPPSPGRSACSSRWPSRDGANSPRKAPAQLQGVSAEGLLSGSLEGGFP